MKYNKGEHAVYLVLLSATLIIRISPNWTAGKNLRLQTDFKSPSLKNPSAAHKRPYHRLKVGII